MSLPGRVPFRWDRLDSTTSISVASLTLSHQLIADVLPGRQTKGGILIFSQKILHSVSPFGATENGFFPPTLGRLISYPQVPNQVGMRVPIQSDAKSAALILVQYYEVLIRERPQPLVMWQNCGSAAQRVSSSNSQGRRSSAGPGTIR